MRRLAGPGCAGIYRELRARATYGVGEEEEVAQPVALERVDGLVERSEAVGLDGPRGEVVRPDEQRDVQRAGFAFITMSVGVGVGVRGERSENGGADVA